MSWLRNFKVEHWRLISGFLMVYDMIAVTAAYFMALLLRFDFHYSRIPQKYLDAFFGFLPFYLVFCLVLLGFLRLYRSLWRFASVNELVKLGVFGLISAVFHIVGITLYIRLTSDVSADRMPISYHVIGVFCFWGIPAIRCRMRWSRRRAVRFMVRLRLILCLSARGMRGR